LRPLERGGAAGQILDDLRGRILNGSLPRGAKLPTEREMAASYGVSGATVREAIRALVALHLIEVRHGSGAYVIADGEQFIAQSLSSIIQLDRIELKEIMGVLMVLNAYSAELAAQAATAEDIAEMRSALDVVDDPSSAQEVEAALRRFLIGLAQASHNPLLIPICKFLAEMQIDMARKLAGGSLKVWRLRTSALTKPRRDVLEAIAKGDSARAHKLTVAYHRLALEVIAAHGDKPAR
jgi:GntR family transcriptional repressor for pyruvate dehydrogenase complex